MEAGVEAYFNETDNSGPPDRRETDRLGVDLSTETALLAREGKDQLDCCISHGIKRVIPAIVVHPCPDAIEIGLRL